MREDINGKDRTRGKSDAALESTTEEVLGTASSSAKRSKRKDLLALRLALKNAGYEPLPIKGKSPPMEGWSQIEASDDVIRSWQQDWPAAVSTGILTKANPAFDIDILNEPAAEAVEALVRGRVGEADPFLVRIGKAPKRAVLFCTDEPFKKISINLVSPDGSTGKEKLEFLCDGQQVVCFGLHKETKQPYRWYGGEPGQVARADLPYITGEAAQDLMEAAADLLVREFGYKRAPQRPRNGAAEGAADWGHLAENIRKGHELHDSLLSLSAKMLTSGTDSGATVNFLRGLMDGAECEHDERWKERRDDIPRLVEDFQKRSKKAPPEPPAIEAAPFQWIDPAKIPQRRWLYRPHYIRKFLSVVFSSGGVGKSSKLLVEALAMVICKPLLGIEPEGQLRVWYVNLEDPMEELQRRVAAICLHYGITAEDIGDRLFLNSGRDTPIVMAEDDRETRGTSVVGPVYDEVVRTITLNKIDVMIVDPFVLTHRLQENDNSAINKAATAWGRIADETNSSIRMAHHSRKVGNNEATTDDGRGASALRDAVRSASVLNTMTKEEAKKLGVEEEDRRSYFRADIGKTNLTKPAKSADWFKIVSVELGNDTLGTSGGDSVGVVEKWEPGELAWSRVDAEAIRKIQLAVSTGGPWREYNTSKKELWFGICIAKAFDMDLENSKDSDWVSGVSTVLQEAGYLEVYEAKDPYRKLRGYIKAGKPPTDDTELRFKVVHSHDGKTFHVKTPKEGE
jgi:hypothetical protein